jgi:hypothetical protein
MIANASSLGQRMLLTGRTAERVKLLYRDCQISI